MSLKRAVTNFVKDIFDQPQEIDQVVASLYDDNALVHGPHGLQMGSEASQHWHAWTSAFTENASKLDPMMDKNTVTVFWTLYGKHVGPFGDIPASGKEITCQGISVFHFNENKKVYTHQYQADLLSMYSQLGYYLEKEAYPEQSQIKSDYALLLDILMKMGKQQAVITKKEVLMITFYLQGRTAKEIGEWFAINFRTVQTHLNNGLHKLDCCSKKQLHELVSSIGLTYVFRDFYDLIIRHNLRF